MNPQNNYPIEQLSSHIRGLDLIVWCEVLEHLEFELFEPIIHEFSKSSDKLYLTLPSFKTRRGGYNYDLPKFGSGIINLSLLFNRHRVLTNSMHYWELGYSEETRIKNIVSTLKLYYHSVEYGYYPLNS